MSECKHERIRVFYNAETGEAVSLWACTECDYRFVPIAEAESLRAENERLRADAERYRHIRSNIDAVQALVGPDAVPRLVGGGLKELGRYCDECIDNVMRNSGRVSDD